MKLIEEKVGEQFNLNVFPIKHSFKIHEGFEEGLSLDEVLDGYTSRGAWSTELKQINNIMNRIENG